MADKNRKSEGIQGILGENAEENKSVEEDEGRFGYLNWVHRLIDMSKAENNDLWLEKEVTKMEDLRQGHIIDAQDYLGGWHLAVVCDIKPNNEEFIRVNFVEYPRGNRDEWLKKTELERVSGPFLNTEELMEKDGPSIKKSLKSLREYCRKFTLEDKKLVLNPPKPKPAGGDKKGGSKIESKQKSGEQARKEPGKKEGAYSDKEQAKKE